MQPDHPAASLVVSIGVAVAGLLVIGRVLAMAWALVR
jgi:hypothetical protein